MQGKTPRRSAVLLLLYPNNDKLYSVLMKRPEYDGKHSGQISLPGGKYEEDDIDLKTTAVREFKEEVGVDITKDKIIGTLEDIYIPPSNFLVSPFVAYISQKPSFVPDQREVERLIEYPIQRLLETDVIQHTHQEISNNMKIKVPYFDIDDEIVWGATAMILGEFREHLKKIINNIPI
ncbi:MAG: CoA pyrophosphatase [Cytophagales bacterium]|nr:CoA pyrophosphatase [Cytophagales bacterium]